MDEDKTDGVVVSVVADRELSLHATGEDGAAIPNSSERVYVSQEDVSAVVWSRIRLSPTSDVRSLAL